MDYFNAITDVNAELSELGNNLNEDDQGIEKPSPLQPAMPDFDQIVFKYSSVNSCRDNIPRPHEYVISGFVTRISQHQERADKDGPAIIPALFKKGSTRATKNVETMTALVLDVDDGTPYADLLPRVQPFAHLYHTSHSHSPEHPKYRVIIFLADPIPVAEWPEFWQRAFAYFGHMDPATKDPARLYFAPAHPPGAVFEIHFNPGALLTNGHLPQIKPKSQDRKRSKKRLSVNPASVAPTPPLGTELVAKSELGVVVEKCSFMQYASKPENQSKLSEPIWKALITNAMGFENSDAWIHTASNQHPGYHEGETQARIDRYRLSEYKPNTCLAIRMLGFDGCPEGGCKARSGNIVRAPAQLSGWALATVDFSHIRYVDDINKEVVRQMAGKIFDQHIAFCLSRIMAYCDGYWKQIELNLHVQNPIYSQLSGEAGMSALKKIVSMLEVMYASSEESFDQASPLVCLKNGTLDPVKGDLLPHSPEHFLSNRVEIEYDPKATCPLWLQTLDEIFAPDEDKADKIRLLQEFIGYCLVADTQFHKFLWLVGGGGNGKSLILAILIALLGRENVSTAQIERLESPFVRAELQGKLVNISSEMSADATVTDGYLKQIASGDVIEAERKFKPSFSFKPYARLIAATNALPRLLDHSDGFFRRAIIMRFNRQFQEHEQDKQREQRLMAELPGILNWALTGRKALYARGNFVIPSSAKAEVDQFRVDSDPVQQFIDEETITSPPGGYRCMASEVYTIYATWCRDNGYKALAVNSFSKRLETMGINKVRDNRGRYWELCLHKHEISIIHDQGQITKKKDEEIDYSKMYKV